MATIIGLDGQEQEIIDLTPKQKQPIITYDRKPYQDNIQDKPPEEPYTPVVYASMQHSYPPIKILDMKVDFLGDQPIYVPKDYQPDYIDSRYRGTSLISINYLISQLVSLYFRNSGDLFSLLGPDKRDETAMRMYGTHSSRKTFIVLLREALHEYAGIDHKVLYTRVDWLEKEGVVHDTNRAATKSFYKYRFNPNWVDWIRGHSGITEDRVLLPFVFVIEEQSSYYSYSNSARFAQSAANQTFYSYLNGTSVISYICEYPFLYSIGPDGNFTDASAIFELKDPKFFELIMARTIAMYVKRSLDVIQLPGNVVNFNFDTLIQELNDKIAGYTDIVLAESISGAWNPYNQTKF